jgi:hypothetical protein
MKPIKQTLFFDKDGVGNCFEACIASILEINLEEVPMFHDNDWFPYFFEWLVSKGYSYHGTLNPDRITTYNKGVNGYFIVAGDSPRGSHIKGGHAVVYKDGIMVHDPHPDNTGVLTIKYGMMIEPLELVEKVKTTTVYFEHHLNDEGKELRENLEFKDVDECFDIWKIQEA